MRRQKAIYWQKAGIDEHGRSTFLDPVVIKCRWDTFSPQNDIQDTQDSASVAMTVYPDRVLEVGSYLMLGGEDVLGTVTANPLQYPNAFVVKSQRINPKWKTKQYQTTPNYQSNKIMIEVTL
jgi:hypothetical protein